MNVMTARLEHANITVQDPDAITRFMLTAFPHFHIRGQGNDSQNRHWRHVGDDDFYVALQQGSEGGTRTPYGNTPGFNHLAWEVNDLDALNKRMQEAGYPVNLVADEHPARTRMYFYDPEGNDWEFVQYHSTDPSERNDYSS